MRPSALVPAALLVACAALAGCADDDRSADPARPGDVTTATASPAEPASPEPDEPTGTPSPPPEEQDEPDDTAERPFPADRSADTSPGEGNGLSVVDVRTGTHDGYDRVVWELGGTGTVGWRVEYDDSPGRQGSGEPVELEGGAVLSVLLEGVGYPFDTGVEEYDGPRRQAPRLPSVRELELGGVYEGYYDAFVGVAEARPFRVFRLEDPQRVVLDVQHTG